VVGYEDANLVSTVVCARLGQAENPRSSKKIELATTTHNPSVGASRHRTDFLVSLSSGGTSSCLEFSADDAFGLGSLSYCEKKDRDFLVNLKVFLDRDRAIP
jgi:hypothetical protein